MPHPTIPMTPATQAMPTSPDVIGQIVEARRNMPGALLPILHEIQDTVGFVPADAVPTIARALNLSRAEVHGVVTFYHHFRDHAPGQHVVQVCRAEACQSVGANALVAHAQQKLGCGMHETTESGVTLDPVFCLGQCAIGPAITIDGKLYGHMTAQRFDALVDALDAKSRQSQEATA